MPNLIRADRRFLEAALVVNILCLGLYVIRIMVTGSSSYSFIPENVLLAWLAFSFAILARANILKRGWNNFGSFLWTFLWLIFLPNTWYVMSDFIHLSQNGEINILYDIGLMTSLVISGFFAGFSSLFIMHRLILKKVGQSKSWFLIVSIVFMASFAIYLGRDLRWNSIDIFMNPGGLALNVTDQLSSPPSMLATVGIFYTLIGGSYLAIWRFFSTKN